MSKKNKTKTIIMTKEIGKEDFITSTKILPYNVVGNCRMSYLKDGIAVRIGDKNHSDYYGILLKDVKAVIESDISVGNVFTPNNESVGSFRQSKNGNHIVLKITDKFYVISLKHIYNILDTRGFVGSIIQYKQNNQE